MSKETIFGVKNLLENRKHNLSLLHIAWFGGEPLTAKSVVYEISDYALKLAENNNFSFKGSITTNAWHLDVDTLEKLVGVGVRSFQITLDGPQEIHDAVRKRVDGQGTFDRIMTNLKNAANTELDFGIILRVHLRPETLDAIDDWLPDLNANLLHDKRFSLLFKPVEHLGGKNDENIEIFLDEFEKQQAQKRLNDKLNRKETSLKERHILERTCYAGRPNSLVIRANGDIAKCTVALDNPKNCVGHLHEDGHIEFDQQKLRSWFVGIQDLNPEILGCPLPYVK